MSFVCQTFGCQISIPTAISSTQEHINFPKLLQHVYNLGIQHILISMHSLLFGVKFEKLDLLLIARLICTLFQQGFLILQHSKNVS